MCSTKTARHFFNHHSQSWDDDINKVQLERIETIFREKLSFIEPPFLDLGSGTGVLIPFLKKYGVRNNEIFELDIAYKMLARAQQKYKITENIHYILADAHSLPLPTNHFGTVICFQAFPHFENKYKVAEELQNILKPGGTLIVLHLMGHKELNELHRRAGREVAQDRILPSEKLAKLIESAEFVVKHLEESEKIYLIIAEKS